MLLRWDAHPFLVEPDLFHDPRVAGSVKVPMGIGRLLRKHLIFVAGKICAVSSALLSEVPAEIPQTVCWKMIKFSQRWDDRCVTSPKTRCLCPPPQKLMSR